MKRSIATAMAATLLLSLVVLTVDAWARAGGGGSSGSRGSRSYSAPARPSSPGPVSPGSAVSPGRQNAPTNFQQPQRSGWMSGLMGGLGGLLIGGLIGSMLFGGLGHGLGGGLGLIELLLMAGLAYFAFSWFRKRQAPVPASPAGYAPASAGYAPAPAPVEWRPEPVARTAAVAEAPAASSDLDQGVSHIRQMDGSFDARRFAEAATDVFFKVQAAWMARDMGSARPVLTEEMLATMQRDCDRLRSERRINRLENIAVRSVDVTEAWQERGQDFVTVGFVANLLDYTTDESGTQVIEGSRTEPVKFEEFWTFTRPVGPNAWKLSAIQQPA